MAATRRVPFRILALVLAIGVLAFVVSRAWKQQEEAARAEPPATSPTVSPTAPSTASPTAAAGAASPSAEASSKSRYGVIGPATKNDPHVIRRAIESLSSDPPNPPSPPPPAEKP